MSYIYDFKAKNVGGNQTIEEVDLHKYVNIQLNQRWINEKLVSSYRLTDADGYILTLDFDDRKEDAFDFFLEWRKSTELQAKAMHSETR